MGPTFYVVIRAAQRSSPGPARFAGQRQYLHFSLILIKTLNVGPAPGIELVTMATRSAVERPTD